jgi:predicted SprT family Zn-dependent metalloprotease
MDEKQASELFNILRSLWVDASRREDWHFIIVTGLFAYNVFVSADRTEDANITIDLMLPAIDSLREKHATELARNSTANMTCSFCGKAPPNVRLGAGASAYICNECVGKFSYLLNSK